jgi:hypothetical protein
MAKKVRLSDKERVAIIMFSERHEGSRTEIRRMDKAVDVIDRDFISNRIVPTISGQGLMVDGGFEKLSEEEEDYVFEDEPFKTLKKFLESQTIPYSRRKEHIGRVLMTVMDKMDRPEEVDLGKQKGK